jgi:hypothetical protein
MFDHNRDLSDDIEVLLQETKKDQYLLTLVPKNSLHFYQTYVRTHSQDNLRPIDALG